MDPTWNLVTKLITKMQLNIIGNLCIGGRSKPWKTRRQMTNTQIMRIGGNSDPDMAASQKIEDQNYMRSWFYFQKLRYIVINNSIHNC